MAITKSQKIRFLEAYGAQAGLNPTIATAEEGFDAMCKFKPFFAAGLTFNREVDFAIFKRTFDSNKKLLIALQSRRGFYQTLWTQVLNEIEGEQKPMAKHYTELQPVDNCIT